MSKIDLNIVWDDAKDMARANRDLLIAIAGMFLLLPTIIGSQFMAEPPKLPKGASEQVVLQYYQAYMSANIPVMLLVSLFTSFGMLAMLALLLRHERLTVGESLQAALRVLPGYYLANILQGLGLMTGMLLFVLPGLYLIGRLALIAPVAAAEQQSNPITILRRSAELTRGNGWRIFGLFAIIIIVLIFVDLAATVVTGVFTALLLPADLGDFAMNIASALVTAVMATVIVLISAALYRAATAPVAMPWQPGAGI